MFCTFKKGFAPFIDVVNSLKTILDNVENQTGGRVRYTWPTKFDEQWVDRTGVKQDIPPPANVRGTPMDMQVSSAKTWLTSTRYNSEQAFISD